MLPAPNRVAEYYINRLYKAPGQPDGARCPRYWIRENILVGGSIVDVADAEHLAKDFGVTHVLSVESERDDEGRLGPFVAATRLAIPDVGLPFPPELVLAWVGFYQIATRPIAGGESVVYVHCQAGGSRSPSCAYALLRSDGFSREGALQTIREARGDNWGEHPFHQNYLASIDRCFT